MATPYKFEWYEATKTEIKALQDNDVFENVKISDLPPGTTILHGKFVYKVKPKEDGTISVFKARLVVCGNYAKPGVHYKETWSPVASSTTIRLVLAIAATLGLRLRDIDFKSAYLNARRKENDKPVYMHPPKGAAEILGIPDNYVWLIKRALYGMPDSARLWNNELLTTLKNLGFRQSGFDPCLIYKISKKEFTIATLVVDDMLIASKCKQHADDLINGLRKKYKLKDMGDARYTLGIHIDHKPNSNSLSLSQKLYIRTMVKRYNMQRANTAKMPADKGSKLRKDMPGDECQKDYRALIGSLLYAVQTRPDIATIISDLSRYLDCAKTTHWKAALRVLRYLNATANFSLKYNPVIERGGELTVYVDAAHNYDVDTRRSRTGYIIFFNACPILWRSTLQPIITLSSTEAEYVALCTAAKEALWLKRMLSQIGFRQQQPVKIYIDNRAAIAIAENDKVTMRTRHIDLRFHWVREQIKNGEIVLLHVPGENNPADVLTKIVSWQRQANLLRQMMHFDYE